MSHETESFAQRECDVITARPIDQKFASVHRTPTRLGSVLLRRTQLFSLLFLFFCVFLCSLLETSSHRLCWSNENVAFCFFGFFFLLLVLVIKVLSLLACENNRPFYCVSRNATRAGSEEGRLCHSKLLISVHRPFFTRNNTYLSKQVRNCFLNISL